MNKTKLFNLFYEATSRAVKLEKAQKSETDFMKRGRLRRINEDAQGRAKRRFKEWAKHNE